MIGYRVNCNTGSLAQRIGGRSPTGKRRIKANCGFNLVSVKQKGKLKVLFWGRDKTDFDLMYLVACRVGCSAAPRKSPFGPSSMYWFNFLYIPLIQALCQQDERRNVTWRELSSRLSTMGRTSRRENIEFQ